MCGITGIWSNYIGEDALILQTTRAVAALHHRGPDDSGIWSDTRGVVLGHARLSILDLTDHAHQPMLSSDGRYSIVYNGEIYNYKDIKRDLLALGHFFRGTGDTEVVLAALRQWGTEGIDRFIGMFAIALWDEQEQELTLIRDRVGVKPLYYGWDGKILCFGSELKALRAYEHWTPEIDLAAAGEFFQFGYISSPRTIYRDIYKLPPGHILRVAKAQNPELQRYWSVLDCLHQKAHVNESEAEEELELLMADAFQCRMVSDVPVGLFLSGGVDSSLLTAILASNNRQNIKSFTIGFRENTHDESVWAKKVAQHLGTEHTEYILGAEEALAIVQNWGMLFDEPFGDPSGIPTLLVSRLASSEVKVVLSADGGDELFSGYEIYSIAISRWQKLQRLPSWVSSIGASALGAMPAMLRNSFIGARKRGWAIQKARRLGLLFSDPAPATCYDGAISYLLPEEVRTLIGPYSNARCRTDHYPGVFDEQMCLWDLHHYLPDDILVKIDRTTMHTSIEGREPLLDHRLIEYAFRLPMHMRRGELGSKHILKKILYKHVPRGLVDRPKKGFSIPVEGWLRKDLKPLVHDYLDYNRIKESGVLNADNVRHVVADFYKGNHYATNQIWFLVAFEMWREEWM